VTRDKLQTLTSTHQELSDSSRATIAAASSKTAWLEATLAEKEAAIANMKEQGTEAGRRMLTAV